MSLRRWWIPAFMLALALPEPLFGLAWNAGDWRLGVNGYLDSKLVTPE